jgi:hypothetical protein
MGDAELIVVLDGGLISITSAALHSSFDLLHQNLLQRSWHTIIRILVHGMAYGGQWFIHYSWMGGCMPW